MNLIDTEFPVLAFVDVETTGGNADRDRIAEIGIKTLAHGQESAWECLLDPQTFIPQNIQRLTGITPDMVAGCPPFDELALQIKKELEGKIFVAHNARFDYGFIKASFKRLGMDFRPKVLCTVKLSRLLFPQQARHNLDTLITAHGLTVTARHRALGDADLLVQFWRVCEKTFGQERLLEAVRQLVSQVNLPPNISQSVIDAIPDSAGCYIFYDEHQAPLYIGNSISMRSRVMSHFQSALTVRKEIKLSQQVHHIEWIKTSGELSALILEAQLIKERMPRKNIKQRHDACIDEVSVAVHNLKLQTALQLSKVPIWPFAGAVAIKDGRSLLVINKWCYLGTANDHDELDDLTQSEDLDFDLDIYKIVKKAMAGSHKTHVVKLSSAPEATASFDVLD
jgi:DNA polymerase-3 subunit epsilon